MCGRKRNVFWCVSKGEEEEEKKKKEKRRRID